MKNYAYYKKSEFSRADYIFELTSLSDKKEKIRSAILHSIANKNQNNWNLTQLFELAKFNAQIGDEEAR